MSSAEERPVGAHAGASQDYTARAGAHQRSTGYQPDEAAPWYAPNGRAFAGRLMAGILMIISGLWSFFVGLAAIVQGEFFVSTSNYVINWNITGWGWTELIVGVIVFAAGMCVMLGMFWARVVGVILASLSALNNFMFLPHYPLWSLIIIALDVFIIWALCVRGVREPA